MCALAGRRIIAKEKIYDVHVTRDLDIGKAVATAWFASILSLGTAGQQFSSVNQKDTDYPDAPDACDKMPSYYQSSCRAALYGGAIIYAMRACACTTPPAP